jgi:hypothetical protein
MDDRPTGYRDDRGHHAHSRHRYVLPAPPDPAPPRRSWVTTITVTVIWLIGLAAVVAGVADAATTPNQNSTATTAAITAARRHPAMPAPGHRGSPGQAATTNTNCTLIVPTAPLTAQGLATPYQLTATDPAAGPCNEANADQSAFVQGAIVTPNGQLTLYDPLVIDRGTRPAATPAPATVPTGASVAIWFGFNGDALTLRSAAGTNSLTQGQCVTGSNGSIFGQFAYCNAQAFFQTANAAITSGALAIPANGTASDGLPCPTVRDFSLVDQDQSDNVNTHYLANANGQTAQNNAAGRAAVGGAAVDLANGSDNRLLTEFVLPTLGCTDFTKTNGADDGTATASLALQELFAAANQKAPIALVPLNDPMTLVNGQADAAKTNLFRAGTNQPAIGGTDTGDPATYCTNIFTNPAGIQRVFTDEATFAKGTSPNPGADSNLFTFLADRANVSFTNLGCGALLNQANPVTLTTTNNIVTAATFAPGQAATPTATTTATPTTTVAPTATATTTVAPTGTTTSTVGPTAITTATVPATSTTRPPRRRRHPPTTVTTP